jgi:hypothetical protein
VERGEVQGNFGTAWSDVKTNKPEWLSERKIKIIVQHGFKKNADLPDVPLFLDQAQTEADRQVIQLLVSRQDLSKPYFLPPEVPGDRVTTLRRAFDATLKDSAFLAEAKRVNLEVDGPMPGEELAEIIGKLSQTPPAVVDRIEALLAAFQAKK